MAEAWDPFAVFRRLGLALLVAVVVAAGFQAGRLSEAGGGSRPVPSPTSSPPPPGERQVDWPGAARMVELVPVGYSQSREGAVSAATNFAQVLRGPVLLDEALSRSAVETVSDAPDAPVAAQVVQRAKAIGGQLQVTGAVGGNAVEMRFSPVAYSIDSYKPEKAVVSIWGVWLVGRYLVLPATQSWLTLTDTLLWAGGDWKLHGEQEVAGPAPRLGEGPLTGTDLPDQLARYQPFRSMPSRQS